MFIKFLDISASISYALITGFSPALDKEVEVMNKQVRGALFLLLISASFPAFSDETTKDKVAPAELPTPPLPEVVTKKISGLQFEKDQERALSEKARLF